MNESATRALRVANCSGFYGDRVSAAKEMVEGGPIDVLTGDWLAELTMLILAKNRAKDRAAGYARTFVTQMEQVMGTCLEKGIKVVANAGGLNPAGCADAVAQVAQRLGLNPRIAYVEGDDLLDRIPELRAAGHSLANLDTGEPYGDREALTANAYLGAWGIVDALGRGADIVVTGRVTDAAVVVAPAAWHFGWGRTDWDQLAGAVVAGHIIECGCQATGGNYAFFRDVSRLVRPGFPIAEISADGSCVITKHPGTDGLVDVGTVTAQLLYEIGGPRYLNPDVVTRFDTIALHPDGPDRVRVSGTKGEPAPATVKVCVNYEGGYRNSTTMCLVGLDIEQKAAAAETALWANIKGGKAGFEHSKVELIRSDTADPPSNEQGVAYLRVTVKDRDARKVGRAFSNAAVELALSNYPGFFTMGGPSEAREYGVYWPTLVPADLCWSEVVVDGQRRVVDNTRADLHGPFAAVSVPVAEGSLLVRDATTPIVSSAETRRVPLGLVAGARSGDKGGNANVGVWTRTAAAFEWLDGFLTVDAIRALMPETAGLTIERHRLANLLAINFVVVGLLEEGVASSSRLDAQAKSLGEYLRAKLVDVPAHLL